MLGRLTALFAATALMGCATTPSGPPIASLATMRAPPAGQARIVVMRSEKGFYGWSDRGVPTKVDDQPIGEILTGAYVSADRPAGRHQISAELWDQPGVSRLDFNAASGRTYYFAVKVKQKVNDVNMAAMIGGLAGYALVAAATNDNTGPFDLTPMSDAEARRAMAEVR